MPPLEGVHEVLEEIKDELEQKTSENKMTIPSLLLQERDEDLEMQEPLGHSAREKKINIKRKFELVPKEPSSNRVLPLWPCLFTCTNLPDTWWKTLKRL